MSSSVRVAGLLQQIENNVRKPGLDGRGPSDALELIRIEADRLMNEAHDSFRDELLPALEEQRIRFVDLEALDLEQRAQLDDQKVFPVLTPLAFDPGRPFPHISNLGLNIAVVIRDPSGKEHTPI